MHISPVDGLPLLRLSEPRFSGISRTVEHTADKVAACLLLLLVAPVLLLVALLVKLHDRGPVFFTQDRVGAAGAPSAWSSSGRW